MGKSTLKELERRANENRGHGPTATTLADLIELLIDLHYPRAYRPSNIPAGESLALDIRSDEDIANGERCFHCGGGKEHAKGCRAKRWQPSPSPATTIDAADVDYFIGMRDIAVSWRRWAGELLVKLGLSERDPVICGDDAEVQTRIYERMLFLDAAPAKVREEEQRKAEKKCHEECIIAREQEWEIVAGALEAEAAITGAETDYLRGGREALLRWAKHVRRKLDPTDESDDEDRVPASPAGKMPLPPWCTETIPVSAGGIMGTMHCSLSRGHEGQHESRGPGGNTLLTWPKKSETMVCSSCGGKGHRHTWVSDEMLGDFKKCTVCNGSGHVAKMTGVQSEPDEGEASSRAVAPVVPGASTSVDGRTIELQIAKNLRAALHPLLTTARAEARAKAIEDAAKQVRRVWEDSRGPLQIQDHWRAAAAECERRIRAMNPGSNARQDVAGSIPAVASTVAGSRMPEGERGVDPAASSRGQPEEQPDTREQTGVSSTSPDAEALERSARTLIACIIDWSSEKKRFKEDVAHWAKHVVSRHYRPILATVRAEALEAAAKECETDGRYAFGWYCASRIRALGEKKP